MRKSTIIHTLNELGTRPTRSLGQNFLHDENIAAWIVRQLDLQPGEHLVEVGPGLGALTEFAIQHDGPITLIEKDGRLAEYLKERFADKPNVTILHQDALEFDTRTLFEHGPCKVLGNLPYYISSQVLLRFTDEPTCVSRLVFTLQKEMAERLSAQPSSKEYGALTLLVGLNWKVHYLKTLPGEVFFPAPNVESAVIALEPRDPEELPDCNTALFRRLVKEGFAQRRKMLRKMLAHHHLDWSALCQALGLEETVRGEALSLRQWVELTRYVENVKNPGVHEQPAQDVHGEEFDVVDGQNRIIGRASRHEVHEKQLRHRAIHLFVFNKRGELFLQKRSRWKDANPGRWDSSAAGHLPAGEDYETTARRELKEELGVEVDSLRYLGELPASPETGHEFLRLYEARHNGPFSWPRSEVETGGFFPIALLERWVAARPDDFSSTFRLCFEMWMKNRTS